MQNFGGRDVVLITVRLRNSAPMSSFAITIARLFGVGTGSTKRLGFFGIVLSAGSGKRTAQSGSMTRIHSSPIWYSAVLNAGDSRTKQASPPKPAVKKTANPATPGKAGEKHPRRLQNAKNSSANPTRPASKIDSNPYCQHYGSAKTTIEFPEEVIQRAKITAIRRKTTLKELICQSLIREIESPQARSTDAESQRKKRASALLDSLDAIQIVTPIGRFDREQAQRYPAPAKD